MSNKTTEIGELTSILSSRTFFEVIDKHKKYLQGEANRFVKAQDITNAYAAVASIEDADRLVGLMKKMLEELQK